MADLILRNARVVDATQDGLADVAVANGVIYAVGENITDDAPTEIDAGGLTLLPGLIDAHVHFNEPGRAHWEGFATGTAALVKGGVTSFFDMPLNSDPPTISARAFDEKRQLADTHSRANAYLWGGLIPGNLDELAGLAERGVIGFKAFMSNSGIAEFPHVDDYTLYTGMNKLAELGKILAVHAENDAITNGLAQAAQQQGKTGVRDYLESRPAIAELEAIQRMITLSADTGCAVHIVHVSTAQGVDLVQSARQAGVDITCETCPHYLVLTADDVESIGAAAKCAPPMRSAENQSALWERVLDGRIPMIASDHSPAPMSLKQGDDFFAIWGGIASCQSTLSLMLTYGYHQREMDLKQIAAVTSANVAERFGLTTKGRIAPGADADLTLADIDSSYTLRAEDLAYRHPISPYIGYELRGVVQKTWVKGRLVYG